MKDYDAIIIGFGKGGKTLAADLAQRGQRVAVVERSASMYGGTCINIGCIPTKSLVYRAKLASQLPGRTFAAGRKLYREAIDATEKITSALREMNYRNLADREGIDVITGTGKFLSGDTVSVATAEGELTLRSKRIFIDTGARTVVQPIEGVAANPFVHTSTTMLRLRELPRRLVIVGGGYIGLEFASIYASFGSQVTVLEGGAEFIPREDRDIAAAVRQALERKGIAFRLNARVSSVKHTTEHAVVTFTDAPDAAPTLLEADAVLLATGRRPETGELNLPTAGVETDARGAIVVDDYLRTTNPAIRALGDVKGGLQFTYISLDDYRIVRDDLFGDGVRTTADRDPVSYSVYIDPPLSRIGMGEDEARLRQLDIEVWKLPVAAIPRTRILGDVEGVFKAVVDRRTGKILGCTLFGPESHEVINTVALAMKAGLDYTFLRDFIFTHPSMSEALNQLFS